jgi:hypothetical protein
MTASASMPRSTSSRLALRIAGLTFDVSSTDISLSAHGAAEPFRVAPTDAADIKLTVRRGRTTFEASGEQRVFDSGGVWTLGVAGDENIYRFSSAGLGPVPYKVVRLSSDTSRGEVIVNADYFAHGEAAPVLEYPLDEVLFVSRIWRAGGVEVHGCAVDDGMGTGALFVGHSGAGKSTMARLWAAALPTARILSDDRVVIRDIAGHVRMFGTPWHGDACFARAASAPVSAIFVVGHGKVNAARRLGPVEAAAQLFARVFVPFHDAAAICATLEILEVIARTVPVFALDVVPDTAVVAFAQEIIKGCRRT